jgi:hypothetical protein
MTTYSHPKPPGTPTWVDLMTPNVEAACQFYRAIFGWDYDIGGPEFGGYANARLGSRLCAGIGPNPPDAPPMPARWSVYFATDNIEADVARGTALGAAVLAPAMTIGAFGSLAICADPDGAAFGFWQAGQHIGAQVTDEPGAITWHEFYAPKAKPARDFYAALLNASAEAMPGDMEYYVLKHGEIMLGGIMQTDPAWGHMPAHWANYFAVANIEETVALITKHGGQIMGAIDDSPYGRFVGAADPQGAAFKVIQLSGR